jgi:outer membrane murein-binding lipoprotein Lpp
MTRTLFDITNDLQALDDLLSEMDGDVSEGDAEVAIDKWLTQLGEERDNKLNAYAYLIKSLDAQTDALKSEMDRLRARRNATENKIAKLKERLQFHLETSGTEKIKTDLFTFAVQKSGGKPKVVLSDYYLEHPVELPEGMRRVKFEADLEAIREAIENDPENNKVFGYIAEPGRHLRIR